MPPLYQKKKNQERCPHDYQECGLGADQLSVLHLTLAG